MNSDVLECKRKAKEMITSQNLPCNENGRKKGYIEVMKDLWNKRGYGHLEFKSQNLRDKALRLEKIQERAVDSNTADIRATDIDERDPGRHHVAVKIISNEENNDENQNNNDQQSQNANSASSCSDLHTTAIGFPEELRAADCNHATTEGSCEGHTDVPGNLPQFGVTNTPSTLNLGTK